MNIMQLTLVFNPAYDNGVYVPDQESGGAEFFRRFVGCKGLLNELELRLGLTTKELTPRQQLAAYLKAVQAAAETESSFFCARSLELAPLATAKELLAWRDELVLAGWTAASPVPTGLTTGAKAILDGLAAVEKVLPSGFRTESDRWQQVLADLKSGRILEDVSITLTIPERHFHPLFKTLLDLLRQRGIKVGEELGNKSPQIEIKHFRDSVDASLWAVTNKDLSLLVCADSQTLGTASAAFGQAVVNTASTDTPKPVEHLFVSAMMLLKDGRDLQAMRDYLSSPSHPLNAAKMQDDTAPTLREALLRHIIRQGGFGKGKNHKDFNDIIEEYAGDDTEKLGEYRSFLPAPGNKLTFSRIKEMCDRLSEWANGAIRLMEEKEEESPYDEQWSALVNFCSEMEFQCQELGFDKLPEIKDKDFIQAVRSVYTPKQETVIRAEVGSAPVSAGIENIAENVQDVIWVDGAFANTPLPLSFLCEEDAEVLANAIPGVWAQEDALALEDDLFKAGLSRISGKLTILYCDTFQGKKKEKHPYIVQVAGGVKPLENLPYELLPLQKAETCNTRNTNTVKKQFNVDMDGLILPEHETPTSLEAMFEQPFDWFVKYVLGLYEERDTNMSLIKGNVAHDVIHKLYAKAATGDKSVTADAFEHAFQTHFDSFFEQSVLDTGAELSYAENTLERQQFKTVLRKESIPELIRIIRFSKLTIMGSEVECNHIDLSESGYKPLRINAKIDLLLKNSAGHYVILDFKWTGSKGRNDHIDQIKKGTDYQLALYRKIVEKGAPDLPKGTVDAQGFYMLRTAELLTAYDGFHDGKGAITPIPPGSRPPRMSPDETMTDIQEKYSAIVRNLRNGTISVGNLESPYLDNKVLKGKLN